MIDRIKNLSEEYWNYCISIRRHLHQNPELSFGEVYTSGFIESELKKLPLDQLSRVDKNGLIGIIKGDKPGKTIMLRADIDALPITEENTHDYISKNNGVMHACGHDAHSAMLITAAKILCDLKNEFNGTIKLLFQPAEERIPGGAPLMIKGGVLENPSPDVVLGQHVRPNLKVGQVGIKSGKFMASTDEIYITFKGKGGHAAMPETCIDPILIASNFIVTAQQIVSRNANPKIPSVLSFGKIIGNGASNVIPNNVTLDGTFRTLDESWRKEALKKIEKLATSISESMGGSCEINIAKGYPHLYNNEMVSSKVKEGLIEYLSNENVIDIDTWMAAEDFAYYSHLKPSCFYMLGVQNEEKNITAGLHTPTFDIDEEALKIGSGLMAYLAIKEVS